MNEFCSKCRFYTKLKYCKGNDIEECTLLQEYAKEHPDYNKKEMTMKQTYELMLQSWNSNYLASTDKLAKQMCDTNDMQNIITALERQVPMKVIPRKYFYGYVYHCPHCDLGISSINNNDAYCSKCGQALDWSEVK